MLKGFVIGMFLFGVYCLLADKYQNGLKFDQICWVSVIGLFCCITAFGALIGSVLL